MGSANGRDSARYRRNNKALRDSLPPYCSRCGDRIDFTLPPTHPKSWTTDHTVPLAEGGDLYGHRTLMCRECNSKKEMDRHQAVPKPVRTTEDW